MAVVDGTGLAAGSGAFVHLRIRSAYSLLEGAIKADDGEAGAGMVILRMLERAGLRDHVVIVTRWYGGKHLGGDRFRHVQEAVRLYLAVL